MFRSGFLVVVRRRMLLETQGRDPPSWPSCTGRPGVGSAGCRITIFGTGQQRVVPKFRSQPLLRVRLRRLFTSSFMQMQPPTIFPQLPRPCLLTTATLRASTGHRALGGWPPVSGWASVRRLTMSSPTPAWELSAPSPISTRMLSMLSSL